MVASRGAADDDEAPTAGALAYAAKGKLVSAMMKKYLAEAMAPMLLELKRLLEAARHPLLGQLLATLAALLKEHKHEVGALLVQSMAPSCTCCPHWLCSKRTAGISSVCYLSLLIASSLTCLGE